MEEFERRHASLVAIAVDPPERARALAEGLHLTIPLLADPSRGVIRSFGVEDVENGIAWPAVFVIGHDGKVVWRAAAETYKKRPTIDEILKRLPSQ